MEPLPHKSQIISNGHAPDLQGRNIDVSINHPDRYLQTHFVITQYAFEYSNFCFIAANC